MTNTGDFRRYSYDSDVNIAIDYFNATRSSASPAYRPEERRSLRVKRNSGINAYDQVKTEEKFNTIRVAAILGVCICVVMLSFGVLSTFIQKNELRHKINNLNREISIAESENTRINSEINSLISMSMIDQYAVEKLNMTKVQTNQIRYINTEEYKEARQAELTKSKE